MHLLSFFLPLILSLHLPLHIPLVSPGIAPCLSSPDSEGPVLSLPLSPHRRNHCDSIVEGVGDVNICIEDLVRVETPQKEVWLQHRRNKKPFIVENQYQDLID